MSPATATTGRSHSHPMRDFVARQLQNGMDNEAIIQELGKSGIQENAARHLVDSVGRDAMTGALHPGSETSSAVPAILGGLIASVLAGCIWGGLVILTGYEFGMVAWFLGAAVGYTIVLFSKGERGSTQQTVAVAFSILGILVGKYLTFYYLLKQLVSSELGSQTAGKMSVFSFGLMTEFLANMGEVFGPFDLLWVGLAVISAWKITDDI